MAGTRGRRAAGIPGRRGPPVPTPRVTRPAQLWQRGAPHMAPSRGVARPTTASGRGRYPRVGPAPPRPARSYRRLRRPRPRPGAEQRRLLLARHRRTARRHGGGRDLPVAQPMGGAGRECPRVTAGCGGAVNEGEREGQRAGMARSAWRSGDIPQRGRPRTGVGHREGRTPAPLPCVPAAPSSARVHSTPPVLILLYCPLRHRTRGYIPSPLRPLPPHSPR